MSMTTTTNKQPKPKPPILESSAPGNLNPIESKQDSERVLKAWRIEQGHTRGYHVLPRTWKRMLHTLWQAEKMAIAPDSERTRDMLYDLQDSLGELRETMTEFLAMLVYDEKLWREKGELKLTDTDDERKIGFYVAVNPFTRPEKRVYSPLGEENKQDNLVEEEED